MKRAVFALMLFAGACSADSSRVRATLERALNPQAEQRIRPDFCFDMPPLENLTASDMQELMSLGLRCLRSSRHAAQECGLMFFLGIAGRVDAAKLLEPYVPVLAGLAADRTQPVQMDVLKILAISTSMPGDHSSVLRFLAGRLGDQANSKQELIFIITALLPTADPVLMHRILTIVSSRSDQDLRMSVVHSLGLNGTDNEEAAAFVGDSLSSENPYERRNAVDALSRLSPEIRKRFAAQLGRIAGDPKEPREVREQAMQALR